MKSGKEIIIEKVLHFNDEYYTNESAKDLSDGQKINGIPSGYVCEGILQDDIEVDKPVFLFRTKRNGDSVPGIMKTSVVTEINGNKVKTNNSTYIITVL